ncbi:hypothetical protein KCM76_05605 [Zooshikella marina]|uniref:hypothetical protein n=1 Tax=Zooshikellaceae TaxID=2898533 RepID=UPI001BAE912D|nr:MULTISPECIES: hypothetical protein [Zooshikellaceae]MBU2705444.1 hypothetical protein [Zooshikella ganghwensis]MCX4029623.1 hypothetical protein [Spartinivicinus marinus]
MLLTKTKRQLRTGVKLMNQVLSVLKMEKAPDKTFIGRITKGFIPGILPFTLRAS